MQYSWLEKLVKEGHVRPDIRDSIYKDCSWILEKKADWSAFWEGLKKWPESGGTKVTVWEPVPPPEPPIKMRKKTVLYTRGQHASNLMKELTEPVIEFTKQHPLLTALGTSAATLAGTLTWPHIEAKLDSSKRAKELLEIKNSIITDPSFDKYKEKANARFDEVVRIAPAVALNKDLVKRLVSDRLHSGFTTQDVQSLALLQTQATKNQKTSILSKEKYFNMKKTSEARILADVVAMCKTAGILEKEAASKASGTWEATKKLLKGIGMLSGVSLLGSVGVGVANYARAKYEGKQFEKALRNSFEEAMRQSDPHREALHANKDKAMMAFQTLVHFAPSIAVEPSAARAFMNTIVSQDQGTHITHLKELSEVERNLQATKGSNPFFEGMAAGAEALGLSKTISQATNDLLQPVMYQGRRDISESLGIPLDKKTLGLPERSGNPQMKAISSRIESMRNQQIRARREQNRKDQKQIDAINKKLNLINKKIPKRKKTP